jgi:hypothetical protein
MRRRLGHSRKAAAIAMMMKETGRMKNSGPWAESETSRCRSSVSPSTNPSSSAGRL